MVQITQCLMRASKMSKKKLRGTFMDKIHMHLHAGSGGMGNQKFGGIGGKGGDIYMKATKVRDLFPLATAYPERRVRAGNGANSSSKMLLGMRGNDVTLEVPCGVRVITDDKLIMGEVNEVDEQILLARGGIGGNPATDFSGQKGQKLNLTFELSLIADVGLLGFPNAGKSTLLRACSNAKPKVADYPFTTIKPNLGILQYSDFRKITMADLPGLIEGAHANFGMGHTFLRHIERTSLVLMIVDVLGFQLGDLHKRRSALETIMLLNKELELYNPAYLDKPMILVVNKMDLPGAEESLAEIKDKLSCIHEFSEELPEIMKCEKLVQFEEIIAISADQASGIDFLKDRVRASLTNHAEKALEEMESKEEKLERLKLASGEDGPPLI